MQISQRLDALTSLRFFAAMMIVVHHSGGLFGLSNDPYHPFFFGQGVSFFFVLSGFILAYVYPKLDTWLDVRGFWRARIARIWPALLASFMLAYWLLSLSWSYKIGISNLLMINAWIPFPVYFFSYNSPSWSISAEFFFYLAFPVLIYQWNKTWQVKLLASGSIVVLLIVASNLLQLPGFSSMDDGITRFALLYIHPVSRVFEFTFGVFVAFFWRKKVGHVQWSKARASLYEIAVILLAGASMHFMPLLAEWTGKTWLGLSVTEWLLGSGSMFVFGLLIYVVAMGRGRITDWLSHPMLVLLGEISFSLYLLHQILLRYYQTNIKDFPHLPDALALTIFWVIVLLASYLMWAVIEMPGRHFILGQNQKKIHGSKVMRASWHHPFNLNRNTVSASMVLTGLIASIYFSMGNSNYISLADAQTMTPKELQSVVGARFGNLFMLRGVNVEHKTEGLYIELAWESLIKQKLIYSNGIHLTDADGNILVQADYKQPMHRAEEKPGAIWKDSILIPTDKLKGGEIKLAIALYKPNQLLPVDRGERDWGNQRLLINLIR